MPHVEPTSPWPRMPAAEHSMDNVLEAQHIVDTMDTTRPRVRIDWNNPDATDLWEAIQRFTGVPTLADLMQDMELVNTVKAALEDEAANPVVKHPDIGPGEEI